jgi:two-component system, OmpR family, phosphate regulon sensor histidine kinase PhoR
MRNKNQLSISIVIFVMAQLSWFSLLGLFISRFIISRNLASQMEGQASYSVNPTSTSLFVLVAGGILYVVVSVAMSIIFKNLSTQLRLTSMYDTFIANITHELKSPLASIHLHLETLSYREMSKQQQGKFVDMMLNDATRLEGLINAILKISALEQKKDVFEVQVQLADATIKSILEEGQTQFRLKPHELVVEGQANVECVIDRNALKIVFDNLIDNAIKYSVNPVRIHVQLDVEPKAVLVEFQDNGIGISTKDQKKIFNKFHRIAGRYSPSVKGSGLGLYWVREIIRSHAGRIEVFSRGEGTGTLFRIKLPIYQIAKTRYLNNLIKWTNRKKRQQDRFYEQSNL